MMILLCKKQAVPQNGILRIAVQTLPAIAVYHLNGSYYATDDRCSHGNASLSAGFIEGNAVVCPLHFGSFDIRTGEAVDPPCSRAIVTYTVIQDGDDLLLDAEV
jgi:p-cumate 2,3-dioxygenase ferredoxin subunit